MTSRRTWIPTLLLLGALLGCGLESESIYDVTGVVQAVDSAQKQVKIAHDDIPGLMPAMTMSFDVARAELLDGITAGTPVRFKLERSATSFRILELTPTGIADPSRAGDAGFGTLLEIAPEFELLDQEGRPRTLAELSGRIVLLDFVFTSCPGPCPMLTSAHVELQRQLPAELAARTWFVSISLDPQTDTPEKLREYATRRGADLSAWWFLTGEPDAVSRLLKEYQVGSIRRPDGNIDHLVVTYLIGPDRRIAQRYLGLEHKSAKILADLEALMAASG